MRVPAQDPDDTGLPDSTISPLPSYQDEGSLGEQTRSLPVVSTDHDSDGVLFYGKDYILCSAQMCVFFLTNFN